MSGDIPALIDAIATAWTKSLPSPYGSGEYSAVLDKRTDCNRFVSEVARTMGCDVFRNMRANDMVALMASSDDFREVDGVGAQAAANVGQLVIAGWCNPNPTLSGHVAVVRPGRCASSAKWKIPASKPSVPKVANVGTPERCRIDLGANFAFAVMPRYFVWEQS